MDSVGRKLRGLQKLEVPPLVARLFVLLTLFFVFRLILYSDSVVVVLNSRKSKTPQDGLIQRGFSGSSELSSAGECDVYKGSWEWDEENYPLYRSKDCEFLDQGFRCEENGRPDDFYAKWRWQPESCDLPRFNAKTMLEMVRNQRVVFVGDSIGRNQWESLLCMLSPAVRNRSSIYEVNGSPITKHNGFLVFKFEEYNCTIEYYRAPFLVMQGRPPAGSSAEVILTVKLDVMDWSSPQWKNADILIFNTGHWWNYEKTIKVGCFFEEGGEVKTNMTVVEAYRRSIETVMQWIEKEIDQSKTYVMFRTYAPTHFSNGDWNNGGSCHMEKLPELFSPDFLTAPWKDLFFVALDVIKKHKKNLKLNMEVMNVTYMTAFRKDGHMSIYYLAPGFGPSKINRQDCSHWCLPGVPDAWNELLYATLLRCRALDANLASAFDNHS